jgi:peptidoglycan/xylan/chitin deacetylase (PgdA/CDA1 family)
MYHQIGRPVHRVKACEECVSPVRFERQMRALIDAGYRAVTMTQLAEDLPRLGTEAPPQRTAVVTFDDGLSGQFVNGYTVLRRLGLVATFFLVAARLGTREFQPHLQMPQHPVDTPDSPESDWRTMAWEQAGEMVSSGMEIGCHSLTHRSLGALAPAELDAEVRRSKHMLEHRLGTSVTAFAYPFGSRAYDDVNPNVERAVSAAGYRAACTTTVGSNDRETPPFALRRIPIEERDGPFRMRCKLAGAYDWVGAVKSRWQTLAPREERVDLGSIAEAS